MPFDVRVNYLSHSVLAAAASDDPLFALGAMLPDLANMARTKLPRLDNPALSAGIVFHERTDKVFHETRTFIELNQRALAELRSLGVSRGPARATAHIGTEMLIDANFVEDPVALKGYLAALGAGAASGDIWSPLPVNQVQDFTQLLLHLQRGGAALHHPSEERFVRRLSHALAGRPRLEPTADELTILAAFCARYADTVRGKMPRLLEELEESLFPEPNESSPGA